MDVKKIVYDVIGRLKKDNELIAILLIGKAAKTAHDNFHILNDIDLLAVYDDKRKFERQVEKIKSVPFDISFVSIYDLIHQIDDKHTMWLNILMNGTIYYAKNELIYGVIDRAKSIYLEGPKLLTDLGQAHIRFDLTHQLESIQNRMKDHAVVTYLMNTLFNETIKAYYALNNMWIPKPKKMFKDLEIHERDLYHMALNFQVTHAVHNKMEILESMVIEVLLPFGGLLDRWEKGPFDILK